MREWRTRDWSEEAAMDGNQWWRPWHRTGHRRIENCNMDVQTAIRALLGWSRGQNGPLGNNREGLERSGTSVVEMATAPLERSGERQVGWSAPKTIQNLQMEGHGVDGSSDWGKAWLRRNLCDAPAASGVQAHPVGSSLLMVSNGVE